MLQTCHPIAACDSPVTQRQYNRYTQTSVIGPLFQPRDQCLQNQLARVVRQAPRTASATDLRRQPHWLPVRQRIVFKLATVTYKARQSGLPAYLQCEIHDDHPSRTLRSTSALLLQQQPATVSFGATAFCAAAPTVWNSLGVHTSSADTFLTFKNRLKTELFKSCYSKLFLAPSQCSRFPCEKG